MTRLRCSSIVLILALVAASCGGGSDGAGGGGDPLDDQAPADEALDDLDLSVDIDELEAEAEVAEDALDNVDLSQGYQCPTIANQTVADLAPSQLAQVQEGQDGCIFYFGTSTDDIFIETAQASADILLASTGGRTIEVPNALAAFVFDEGFLPENLPDTDADGDGVLDPGRQVIGYFLGSRGVRLIAVFPDAVVGIYDGADATSDEAARAAFFVDVINSSIYAS
jgi:hypothetical protein